MRKAVWILLALGFALWPVLGQGAYEVMEVSNGGVISGRVAFVGEVPKLEPIPVLKDAEFCGQEVPSNALVVSKEGRGLKNVLVYLEGVTQGKPFSAKDALLDNRQCHMTPHVLAMGVGGNLAIKNSDSILHSVRAFQGASFNIALPLQGRTVNSKMRKPGVIHLGCDPHPFMGGYVHVMDHPYYAVTDASGAFRIEGVPPGRYTLRAWHEGWKVTGNENGRSLYEDPHVLTKTVSVPEKGEARVDFEFVERK